MVRPRNSNALGLIAAAVVALAVTASHAAEPKKDMGAVPLPDVGGATVAAPAAAAEPAVPKKKGSAKARGPSLDQTVTVALPPGDDVYPDKPGAVVVDRNCLSCHSPEIVANQPSLSRAQWAAVIGKMRDAYKAPIADGDVQTILDYLVSLRGESRTKWR
jgi:mono/diheme cytochrome c family protein